MLDLHTFGNSAAAVYLVRCLDEIGDTKLDSKVAYILQNNNVYIKQLKYVQHENARNWFITLYRNYLLELQKNSNLPKIINDLVTNILITQLRKILLSELK